MHRPYRDLQNLKFSCLYLFPFSHKVVPQKASGGGGRGGRGGGGRIPHFNWSIYRGGNFFFFFFFFESGLKLDERSIENGLEGQKFLVVCLFWGGCHHPNDVISFLQTQKLQAEQLQYVKQSMRAAKEFDTDYQNTITELQNKIETALKEKQDTTQNLQREESGNCQKSKNLFSSIEPLERSVDDNRLVITK